MTDFNMTALIRQVIDETDLATPDEIADKVAEMVPSRQLRAALAELLREVVRVELTRTRSNPVPVARRVANPSAKVRGLRQMADAWRRRLRDRIHIGQGPDAWKLLADCTATDFRFAADERRTMAAGILAAASEYDSFAEALDTHSVTRFADLPESVQADLLGGMEKAA